VTNEDGTCVYEMLFAYEFRDRYNWDKGLGVGILGADVHDERMGRFHLQGLAREFDMWGTVGERIRWKCGEEVAAGNPEAVFDG